MVYALEVGYLGNSMMTNTRFPRCCCRASLLRYGRARPSDFTSRHGLTAGPTGVSTASQMWLRAFRDDAGRLQSTLPDEARGKLVVQIIGMVTKYYGAPVVNKWTGNAARMAALADLFPQAVFVRVRRDALDVAQSMLNARRAEHNDPYKPLISWPAEFDQPPGAHYTEQIAEHLLRIERAIDRDAAALGEARLIEAEYERFCRDPNAEMARIRGEYEARAGLPIVVLRPLPESFPCSHGQKVSDEDYEALQSHLRGRGLPFTEQSRGERISRRRHADD